MPATALQACTVSTLQHVFQTEILAHLVIQAQLHAFSPPCCFSPNLPRLPLTLTEMLGLGAHRDREGVRCQFEERHKAFLLCFCFVTHEYDSMCFYAHQDIQNSPRPCCKWPAHCVILFVDLGLSPPPPLSIT